MDTRLLSSELGGGIVAEFERTFADLVGARFAVACSIGTTALLAGLVSCGVRPGSEVIVALWGEVPPAEDPVTEGDVTPETV